METLRLSAKLYVYFVTLSFKPLLCLLQVQQPAMIEMVVECSRKGESEGEGEPHTHQSDMQADAKEIG